MLWLEMSRDLVHGGGKWGFGKCLWSPARNPRGAKWAFWETVVKVKEGDTILHLRGKGKDAAFVGISIAASDGHETNESPPEPGQWKYAESFYRVYLRDFETLSEPVKLQEIFEKQNDLLRSYFLENKSRDKKDKLRLFYVIQSGRLQCLNGAYLSEVDKTLANIILAKHLYTQDQRIKTRVQEVSTSEQIRQLKARIGQAEFSEQVRNNYGNVCCFPECSVKDNTFLIGGHIARWADNENLRGDIKNGICFCLMHDKAFERGMFTLTTDHKIWVNISLAKVSSWAYENLLPFDGRPIKSAEFLPSYEAIQEHWSRHSIEP